MRSNSELLVLALEVFNTHWSHGWEKEVRIDALADQVDGLDPGDYEAACYATTNIFRRRDGWQSPWEFDHSERVESMRDYLDQLLSETLH
jgi:hypothetical protein